MAAAFEVHILQHEEAIFPPLDETMLLIIFDFEKSYFSLQEVEIPPKE